MTRAEGLARQRAEEALALDAMAEGPLSRAELCELTGWAPWRVAKVLERLFDEGRAVRVGSTRARRYGVAG